MDIYVGHSSSIKYRETLYKSLKESKLAERHNLVLPHEDSDEPFDSKKFLENHCDIFIAEVSEASTGLGIELGWADIYEVPVICICRKKSNPSSSISKIFDTTIKYSETDNLAEIIDKELQSK